MQHSKEYITSFRKYFLLFLFVSLFFKIGHAQKKEANFQQTIDSILIKKPTTYKSINSYLKYFRKDTVKLTKLINLFNEKKYLDGKTYAENLLGIRYRNYSLFDKAIQIHQQALQTAKEGNSIEFRVFSLNMLGVDYRRMDANRTALDYNQEALALAETVKEPSLGLRRSIAVSHNSMGNIYLLLKQYELAINQFEQSQIIEKSIKNKLGLAINNHNIGIAKEELGNIKEALHYYKISLELNNEINNSLGKIICNGSIATIQIKQGKYNQAIQLIESNLPKTLETKNHYYIAFEYINLGWAQTKVKNFSEAKKNILKGLEIAENYNFTSAISTAYSHLSELKQFQGDYRDALHYYKLAEKFDKEVSNERNSQYVNDLIIKYDSERKNNQIKDLAKQNEIAKLTLSRNRIIWIIILGLLSLLAIVLYSLNRNQRLKNEKEIIRLEQDAMRSQMNPHFIFNSLNAIKLYIINNEQKNAVYYLNKFSKLIRKILAASRNSETTLADEIDTLSLYMEIENIRFSNEIETNIYIDENLNINTIKIPSLILQPFIENAIWHGLSSKKGSKKITISFEKIMKTHLQITITDNGIGREESNIIKKNKLHKKESIGIKLTSERMDKFCKNFKNDCSMKFVDLKDNEVAIGTKVILKIPLK